MSGYRWSRLASVVGAQVRLLYPRMSFAKFASTHVRQSIASARSDARLKESHRVRLGDQHLHICTFSWLNFSRASDPHHVRLPIHWHISPTQFILHFTFYFSFLKFALSRSAKSDHFRTSGTMTERGFMTRILRLTTVANVVGSL